MELTEQQTRDKIVELLDGCSENRLNLWVMSGVIAGVLDANRVAQLLVEEISNRSREVQRFWLYGCNCDGQLN